MKKVFLGGTASDSNWRERLIPLLKIEYFNPVVDDWNDEAMAKEMHERSICDYVLYVITPQMQGFYSIAEVVDDSNKRPEKTIFCYINENRDFSPHQQKSLNSVGKLVRSNGGLWLNDLDAIAAMLNAENS